MKINTKLGFLLIIISVFLSIFASTFFNFGETLYTNEGINDYKKLNKLNPKISTTYTIPIIIDGDASGVGANNWSWAFDQGYCSGKGDSGTPYLITGHTFNVTSGIALTIKNSHDDYFKIESCSFINVIGKHLKLESVSKGIVTHCDFSDRKTYGIEISNAQDLTIFDNTFENLIHTAVWAESSSNIIITDNSITEDEGGDPSYTNGIHLMSTNYSYVENNDISGIDYDDAAGVRITNGHHNIIMSNEIYDTEEYNESTHHGISLIESFKNNLSQNIIYNNPDNGIVLSNSHNNRIYDNTIYDSIQGIKLLYSNNNTVSQNKVNNNDNGIALEYSNENDILDNIVQNNHKFGLDTGYGISLTWYSDNNVISLNLIQNNDGGIYIRWGQDNEIIKNTIQNNVHNGIYLYYCYKANVISNNMIYNNGGGTHLRNADYTIISYNNFTYNGIALSMESDNNTILKNTISRSNGTGIYLSSSDNNQISENNISYNIIGIKFYSASYNNVSGNYFICNNEHIVEEGSRNYFSNNIFEDCPPEEDGDGMGISGYHPLVYISIILIGVSIFINFLKKRIKIK